MDTSTNSTAESQQQEQVCWVCLEGAENGALCTPCRCTSRPVHRKCLARWQLQSAGRSEERQCRFCNTTLPDWRPALTPTNLRPATPVVSVHFNGKCYRLKVKPGADGYAQFRRELEKITGLSVLEQMQITFQCRSPDTSQELSFKGISAFDAAIHCAAISAAERLEQQQAAAARRSADGIRSAALATSTSSSSSPTTAIGTSGGDASEVSTASSSPAASTSGTSSPSYASSSTSSSSSPRAGARQQVVPRAASLDSARSAARVGSGAAAATAPAARGLQQQHHGPHDMHSVVEDDGGLLGAAGGEQGGEQGGYACVNEHSGAMARVRDMFRRLLAF